MTHLGRFRNVVLPYDAILCDCSIVGFFFPVSQWGEIFSEVAFKFTFLDSFDPLQLLTYFMYIWSCRRSLQEHYGNLSVLG